MGKPVVVKMLELNTADFGKSIPKLCAFSAEAVRLTIQTLCLI